MDRVNNYSIEELIDMLDELMSSATRIPLSSKSAIDIDKLSEIVGEMRLVLPMEIKQAQQVVIDKNNIIAEARAEAEQIVQKAERRREELIEQSEILKEAHRRANEFITKSQNECTDMRVSTITYVESMLRRVEELMVTDINDLRKIRGAISGQQQGSVSAVPMQPMERPGE